MPIEGSSYETEKTVGLIARKVVALWILKLQSHACMSFAAKRWKL